MRYRVVHGPITAGAMGTWAPDQIVELTEGLAAWVRLHYGPDALEELPYDWTAPLRRTRRRSRDDVTPEPPPVADDTEADPE